MSGELCIALLQRDFTATMAQPAVRYALEQFETTSGGRAPPSSARMATCKRWTSS